MFEALLQREMDNHLGYSNNDHNKKQQIEEMDTTTKQYIHHMEM